MKKKCLFFDIDGTLVDEQTHQIPQSTIEALRAARRSGSVVFINTGRPYSHVSAMIKALDFDGYCCGCGTEILIQGKPLYRHQIPQPVCQQIKEKADACRIDLFGENTPTCYVSLGHVENGFVKSMEILRSEGFNNIVPWVDHQSEFVKFCIAYDQHSDLEAFKLFLNEMKVEFIDRFDGFAEIVPQACSKATAIDVVRENYNVDLHDCYVFGDSTNDLPMLKHVPHSVLMGNGTPSLKPIVEKVTARIDQDGIAKALKEYGLIG